MDTETMETIIQQNGIFIRQNRDHREGTKQPAKDPFAC